MLASMISAVFFIFLLQPGSFEVDTLSNGQVTAVISPVGNGSRAGSVISLTDLATGIDFAQGGDFASVHCGSFVPLDGTLDKISPVCAVFESNAMMDPYTGEILPVAVSTEFRLVGRGLEITYGIHSTDTAAVSVPLEADFGLHPYLDGFIKFANQTVENDRSLGLAGQHEVLRVSGNQEVILYGPDCPVDTRFFFPNPSKAIIALSAEEYPNNEYLSMRFFDTEPPRSNAVGPDLHSLLGPGNLSMYYVRMSIDDDQVPIYFSSHPDMYERTASWIMDEIPLIHTDLGYMWRFSETSDDSEYVSASLIRLLEDHPTMNMNILILPDGIFDPNHDSMWYEPGYEESWSHWHSTYRISTEAPDDYQQWLVNIQNNVYPWADRVNLGCHGYHHTPSPDSAWDPFHEFITYEPDEHQERFNMIQYDYQEMGLDPEMTSRTMRPSGNEISLSGLRAMIDHGFEYYSNGARWYEWEAGEWFYDHYLTKYETPHGRIWGANTVWWADYIQMMDYERLTTVMDRGKHGLLGGHPVGIFINDQQFAYDRIDSVCTSLEQDYSNFGWLMPVHFSSLMEELYFTSVDSIRSTPSSATMFFTGSTSWGQTAVCKLPFDFVELNVMLDGYAAEWENYGGNRIFVDVDGLSYGPHCLHLEWTGVGIEEESGQTGLGPAIIVSNPSRSSLPVSIIGLAPEETGRVSLLDLAGRSVAETSSRADESGCISTVLELPEGAPAGVYFVRIDQAAGSTSRKVTILN